MKPNIDLTDEQRGGVVLILNALLSDEYILYTKTRNYHWNVVGHQFHSLHKFFEEQYNALDEIIDEVAERARYPVAAAAFARRGEARNRRQHQQREQDRSDHAERCAADLRAACRSDPGSRPRSARAA